ncbi:MAG: ROK family protein [Ponticaulis sp.]|nr:ROK family protein [Ponticaulis sp.]|tara:strand:+ start:24431 stop:25393 length:963 start_codon:yes stop_codon:yes gene_type:complete
MSVSELYRGVWADMLQKENRFYGGVDAGGTTFKCGVFDDRWRLVESKRVPVTHPEKTIAACIEFFRKIVARKKGTLLSLGIASFGPLNLDKSSASYGSLQITPKPGWSGQPMKRLFESQLKVDVEIDTDVNGALLGEQTFGAARDCNSSAYITVGTGIGAGVFANGGLIGRPSHPEFGHIAVRRRTEDENFVSECPFHSDCLEGLASARAFERRYGVARKLSDSHPGWQLEADYLAQACRSLYLSFRPDRIILGGGLMQAKGLLEKVRQELNIQMDGYAGVSEDLVRELVTLPGLGDQAGVTGAALLGAERLEKEKPAIS